MDEATFKARMSRARLLRNDYGAGYQAGLRRHYHGETFGTPEDHDRWMGVGRDGDPRIELGRGYRDGFSGIEPQSRFGLQRQGTQMQVARINENGMNQIADALGSYHKLGRAHFTRNMLEAWATEAENNFNDGKGCQFEIRATDSALGRAVEVAITADGYDVETVTDEADEGAL